ncbi:dihydrofolate reductase family protein [Psychromicrobium xiongbiense]|uniref:dihydrofolate reductase family protein n=1 Tax=Psychromicrobium xiongbiense TaxID=3051184 RepID=UPI0025569284|nr:dihydrofolate reductase family protein [Psychromicrobium sp. YIM S02556]
MSTITAFESVTVDGVMQGPGRADEDIRGGFTRGGWFNGNQDEVLMKYAGEGMNQGPGLLFGHRTYADVLGYWSSIGPNPFVDSLLGSDKFVVSRSADTVLEYPNSELLVGDAVHTVAALKERYARDLLIMGSGELVRSLHAAGLVDRYALQVYPIVLGAGARLFGDGARVDLTLERSIPTTVGVLIAEYTVNH